MKKVLNIMIVIPLCLFLINPSICYKKKLPTCIYDKSGKVLNAPCIDENIIVPNDELFDD